MLQATFQELALISFMKALKAHVAARRTAGLNLPTEPRARSPRRQRPGPRGRSALGRRRPDSCASERASCWPVTSLAGRARRPPLHSRSRRSAVGALRHPLGHLGVDKADLGPLRYFQEPVLVHEPVAGHGQLFRFFAEHLGHFLYPGAARAGQAGHGGQVVALLGPQAAPGDFVLARQLGSGRTQARLWRGRG